MPDYHRRPPEPGDRLYGNRCERPAIKCGNPWDPQSERVFYGDGTWHSLSANSRGGQSRDAVLILESNQNHATVKDTEICPTLPASMRMGGGTETLIVKTIPTVINSSGGGIAGTLDGNYYKGCGVREGIEREFVLVSYQEVTGALTPGGHPGSYNGQDAYNDMLVTDDGCSMHGERAALPNHNEADSKLAGLYARRTGRSGERGV